MSNTTGAAKLAATLQSRMQRVNQHGSTTFLELGRITSSNGLKLDNLPTEIPSGNYLICNSLKMGTITIGEANGHTHSVEVGNSNSISAGSRVLVGWAGGNPVVIDTIGS